MMAYLIVAVYLLITIGIGLFAFHYRKNTPDDYFLANRGVGTFVLFFTLIATNFSAFFFLGFAGAGYRIGYSYYGIMSFGTALVALPFFFIGHRAWLLGKARGYITPPELIGDRFQSRPLQVVFLAVMVFFTIPYLALQPIGAGYLLSKLTNDAIPYFWGAVLLTAFMVLYVFLGGMRSVAITDVFQGLLMFALTVLAVMYIGDALGGVSSANARVFAEKPELFTREGGEGFFTPRRWVSFMLLFVLAVPMFPQVFMRFFIPASARSLRVAATLYPLVTATLFVGPVIIGVLGRLTFPGLEGNDSDQILPMMLATHAPSWLSALVTVGALAAFMSTMDSQLLALSSMLTRDFYLGFVDREASVATQVKLGRLLVVGLSIIGLVIAYQPPATIFAIGTEAFTGLAILFPTTVAALYWQRATAHSCIASILVGQALLFGYHYELIPASMTLGFLPLVPILVATSIVLVGVSLVQNQSQPRAAVRRGEQVAGQNR
jgi:SSS family solute:Na+ symporter